MRAANRTKQRKKGRAIGRGPFRLPLVPKGLPRPPPVAASAETTTDLVDRRPTTPRAGASRLRGAKFLEGSAAGRLILHFFIRLDDARVRDH